MPRDSSENKLSISDLVAIAKTDDVAAPQALIEPRVLKDIETFIANLEIKSGKKLVHNIILYALYRELETNTLTLTEFTEGFGYFFPKAYNSQNGMCFKLSPKLSNKRRINLTTNHLKDCRTKYGKKKKTEDTSSTEQIPSPRSET